MFIFFPLLFLCFRNSYWRRSHGKETSNGRYVHPVIIGILEYEDFPVQEGTAKENEKGAIFL